MLAGKTYVPILHSRIAEVKALAMLPGATKDLIFPYLVARPWPNAKHLEKTWEKFHEAFGERRFALDLDPYKRHSASKYPAAVEFDALFNPSDGHAAYYNQVREIELAVPVVQLDGGSIDNIQTQTEHILTIDRGAVLRLHYETVQNGIQTARDVISALPDVTVIVDTGWALDLLGREMWASSILEAISHDESERELVVAGSSFPDSFRKVPRDELLTEERVLFDNLVRRHNAVVLTYGDWGSTRSPRDPVPMGGIPPRIDLPMSRECICFRQSGAESYEDVARRTMADDLWPSELNIWGTYQISATAEGLPTAIRGQTAAAAVRVNIHMHNQAHFGDPDAFSDNDEPFTDDF